MKRALKKSTVVLAATIFACLCCSLCLKTERAFAAEKKTLDVYVILGSDEAAGYAQSERLSSENRKASFFEGIENVYYYGSSDGNMIFDDSYEVKFGLGSNADEFGAEIGLADYLSQNTTGEKLIFKYAESGTNLTEGWVSPSLRDSGDSEILWSAAYEDFVKKFSKAVELYKGKNYELRLQGTAWLGEKETDNRFIPFLKDLRKAYESEGLTNASTAPLAIANNEGLNGVFKRCGFVFKTGNESFPTGGNADKTLQLGREIGKTLCEEAKKPNLLVYSTGKGKCDVENSTFENGPITVTFTPTEGYYLSSAVLNGKNVLSKVQEGKLTLETGTYFLEATFSRRQAYALTVENDETLGRVEIENPQEKYYEGDEVRFTVSPFDGYTVGSVLFNGSALTAENDVYALTITTENELVVTYEKRAETPPVEDDSLGDGKEDENKKSGCSSALSALYGVPVFVLLPLLKRKKRG